MGLNWNWNEFCFYPRCYVCKSVNALGFVFQNVPFPTWMAVTFSLANASRLPATPLLRYLSTLWRRSCHNARGGWIAFPETPPKSSAYIPLFSSHFGFLARGYSTKSAMGKTDCHVETVIEIEKRFPFDGETVNRLIAAGASLISEKSFTDTYYGKVY